MKIDLAILLFYRLGNNSCATTEPYEPKSSLDVRVISHCM